jgi:L-alanine-DL-glutamate epimerase-like enolase superfamily enzyme
MKELAGHLRDVTCDCRTFGHPLDLNQVLAPAYLEAASAVSRELMLAEPIPTLCTLVVASAFDAAIHDAFGKAHGRNVYDTYGPDLLPFDLARYLGPEFTGDRLPSFLRSNHLPALRIFHTVGTLDPLDTDDIRSPIGDGLPETLARWIDRDGLVAVKIKLNGDDLSEDVDRTIAIDRVASERVAQRSDGTLAYCLDFNERCRSVDYVVECLHHIRERSVTAFERILYVEQPTARDLRANPQNRMHEAARLRPVVIDESLTDLESLRLARDMGYTGVALKACKGQSHAVLMAAAARKHGLFTCVQDLTCPGASLIHSAGIAARVPAVAGIEANARQYVPAASAPWMPDVPDLFTVRNGHVGTGEITGPGLGIGDAIVERHWPVGC